jgi:hypothetical protein
MCRKINKIGKQEVGIWWIQKRFPRYGVPIWSLWPKIRFLPSIVAEKNVTKNVKKIWFILEKWYLLRKIVMKVKIINQEMNMDMYVLLFWNTFTESHGFFYHVSKGEITLWLVIPLFPEGGGGYTVLPLSVQDIKLYSVQKIFVLKIQKDWSTKTKVIAQKPLCLEWRRQTITYLIRLQIFVIIYQNYNVNIILFYYLYSWLLQISTSTLLNIITSKHSCTNILLFW